MALWPSDITCREETYVTFQHWKEKKDIKSDLLNSDKEEL